MEEANAGDADSVQEDAAVKRKVVVEWMCVNQSCTVSGKDNPDLQTTAKEIHIKYFGDGKYDPSRKRKICSGCLAECEEAFDQMSGQLKAGQGISVEDLPVRHDEAVTLADSDEEWVTDHSDDELIFEVEVEETRHENQIADDIVMRLMERLDIRTRVEEVEAKALADAVCTTDKAIARFEQQSQILKETERTLYDITGEIYKYFKPDVILDPDTPTTSMQTSKDPEIMTLMYTSRKPGPLNTGLPKSALKQMPPKVGSKVYAMWMSFLEPWKPGVVDEIVVINGLTLYKVKMDRSKQFKLLNPKSVAHYNLAPVGLLVGTRVIALNRRLYKEKPLFYAGVVAEPLKEANNNRYLVFFDDGSASYVNHEHVRVVCCQTNFFVWKDVHPSNSEFVRNYVSRYPERPMMKLSVGDKVRVELQGKLECAKVVSVDASMAEVQFEHNHLRQFIYRGSPRLERFFLQAQEAAAHTASAECKEPGSDSFGQKDQRLKANRNVARKSSANKQRKPDGDVSESSCDVPESSSASWKRDGALRPASLECFAKGRPYSVHQCGPQCISDPAYRFDESQLSGRNPLLMPLLFGWKRQLVRFNNKGRRWILYVAPCGRSLRNMDEIHRYLRLTRSQLEVDFFCCEWSVAVHQEFEPIKKLLYLEDVSGGLEPTPVSCVNSLDRSRPDLDQYSTKRLPQEGVNINLDEGFLACCDCTDDCQDKSRCACQQLTIQHSSACNPDALVTKNAGYTYRRLLNIVPSGIFECNQRCKCKKTCLNRVAQLPLRAKLQLFKTNSRGWGIRTLCDIPRGSFICVYVGNLYTNEQANRLGMISGDEYFADLDLIEVVERNKEGYESDCEEYQADDLAEDDGDDDDDDDVGGGDVDSDERSGMVDADGNGEAIRGCIRSSATDTVRQTRSSNRAAAAQSADLPAPAKFIRTRKLFGKDEEVYIMDAKKIGNIGRYLNHSCNPNVFVQNCFVDTHDLRFPWVAFFAHSQINAGNELCWDYQYVVGQVDGKKIFCKCGELNCRGRLL